MKHNYFFRLLLAIAFCSLVLPGNAATPVYLSSTGNDSNDGLSAGTPKATLSAAMALADAGGTINVSGMIDCTAAGSGFTQPTGLAISKNITMQGTSNSTDGFDGKNLTRFFSNTTFTLTLKNLKLKSGYCGSNNGGAIINSSTGTLNCENVIFDANKTAMAGSAKTGAAIHFDNANGSTFKNCIFSNNEASKAGAIYITSWASNSTILFEGCVFIGNIAKESFGGSAILIRANTSTNATCNMVNCTFKGNIVNTNASGGTIYFGNKSLQSTNVNLINCTVAANTTAGTADKGAGVYFGNTAGATNCIGNLYINNCIVENNTTTGGAYSDLAVAVTSSTTAGSGSATVPGYIKIQNSIIGVSGTDPARVPPLTNIFASLFNTQSGANFVAGLGTYNSTLNYYPLQSNSQAIGFGASTFLSAVGINTDQLGNIRPFTEGKCYAGAVEVAEAGALTPPTLTADAEANTVDNDIDITFSSNPDWQTAITAVKIGGTALSASDYTISDGNIRLKPSVGNSLLTVAGSKSVSVVATGYRDATVTQAINAGVAAKLSMKRQPSAPASNGATLAVQPQLYFQDQYGNNTTSADNVTASVGAGSWTIGGTLVKPMEVSGSVNYVSLSATSVSAVSGATITFTSGSLTPVTSAAFNIPAPPVVTSAVNASALGLNPNSVVTINSGGDLTIDQPSSVHSINVGPGAKLTVTGINTLTATNGITLQSNANGTATLVDNFDAPTITGTVEQYLPQGRNWYVSSPVETNVATTADLTSAGAASVSYYSEELGWQNNYTGTLTEGVGYVVVSSTGSNTDKINFNGKLNSGDVPVTLTRKSSAGFAGYNLIANPYPSYINPMEAINANPNLDGTIWYRTRKTVAPFDYKFETVNTTSGVGTNAAGTGTVTGFIPPMQAFWVRTNADNQSFTFTNAMRSHACNVTVGATTVPTTALKVKTQNNTSILRVEITGNSGTDEAVIYFDENASNGFDKYDSRKMSESSASLVPEIYSVVDNEKLVINGLKTVAYDMEIPLGFIARQAGEYSITKSEMTNFETGTRIVLKDKLLSNTLFDLSDGLAYNFSSQTATDSNRFSLLLKAPNSTTGINNDLKSGISVGVNDQCEIVISAPQNCDYSIYNVLGVLLQNGRTTSRQYTVNSKLKPGIYVVCVNNQSSGVIIK